MRMVVDILELVKARDALIVNAAFSVNAGTTFGSTAVFAVPPGEAWWVHNVSLRGTNSSAGTNLVAMRYFQDGAALDLSDTVAIAAGGYASVAMKAQPFWMRPGSQLGYGNEGTGNATNFGLTALVSKFRSGA